MVELVEVGSGDHLEVELDQQISLAQLKQQLRAQHEEIIQQQRELFMNENVPTISTSTVATWSFTQGLVIGQLSVIFVIIVFIKFFVFSEQTTTSKATTFNSSGVIVRRDKKKQSGQDGSEMGDGLPDQLGVDELKLLSILEKTYYDVENHAPESLDWFNVLVAQTISQIRTEALLFDNIYHSLNEVLDNLNLPDYIDKIKLTEIDIGDDFPICSNCRIMHSKNGSGRLEAKIDVDLADTLTLGIETKLLLNHPRPLTAVLPVQLTVSIVRFSGCLTISLINTNDPEFLESTREKDSLSKSSSTPMTSPKASVQASPPRNNLSDNYSPDNTTASEKEVAGTALMFSFAPEYRLETTVKSLIGSRAKLQDVPKISSVIETKIRSWFTERCVEPRFQVVRLPSLWPRTKNTREPTNTDKEE